MLIGIDPRITPDLLHVLAMMGHGDEIVIADANFPSARTAASCNIPEPIDYPGYSAADVARLIAGLMPLEGHFTYSALRMQIDGAPDEMNAGHEAVWSALRPHVPKTGALSSLERQDFYAQAARAFAVIRTGEMQPFGCFILRKGVLF